MRARLALVLVLLVGWAAPAFATATIVASGGRAGDTANPALTTTLPATTTGATVLVVSCAWFPDNTPDIGVSDSFGNTWMPIPPQASADGFAKVQLFYTVTPIVGGGHTFSCDGWNTYPATAFVAASGGTASFDQSTGAFGGPTSTITPGTITPATSGALIVTALSATATSITVSAGFSGFITDFIGGYTLGGGLASTIQSTVAAVTPAWSWSGTATAATGSTAGDAASMASFTFVADGAPAVTPGNASVVADAGDFSHDGASATSPPITTTGATLLVMSCSWFPGTTPTITASDSLGNTWRPLTQQISEDQVLSVQIFYTVTPLVGVGQTFSCTGWNTYPIVAVTAAKGGVAAFDQERGVAAINAVVGSSIAPGTLTPSTNGALVVSAAGIGAFGIAVNSGFAGGFVDDYVSGGGMGGGLTRVIQNTAAPVNPTWSWSGTATAPPDSINAATVASASFIFTTSIPVGTTGTVIRVGDDWQTILNAGHPGDTFTVLAGVHRLQHDIAPQTNQTLIGQPGAIMSGAKLLTGETGVTTAVPPYWYYVNQTQGTGPATPDLDTCVGIGNYPDYSYIYPCKDKEDVYFDDSLLIAVHNLSEGGPGKFWFDYAHDRIYIFDNPSGHKIETIVSNYAFAGGGSGVTLQSLIIEKYGAEGDDGTGGAVNLGTGWTLEDSEIRWNHYGGVWSGTDSTLQRSRIHHNGAEGLGGAGSNILVENNEIDHNNTARYNPGWGGGGSKWVFTGNLTVRGNFSHHNIGPGFWDDINNIDVLYEDNVIEDNTRAGIFHEIGYAATIRNNTLRRNGNFTSGGWPTEGCIATVNSINVEITGNTCEDNLEGIGAWADGRAGPGNAGAWVLQNLNVHDNTVRNVTNLGPVCCHTGIVSSIGSAPFTSRNNHFENNHYAWGPNTFTFWWDTGLISMGAWTTALNDDTTIAVTDTPAYGGAGAAGNSDTAATPAANTTGATLLVVSCSWDPIATSTIIASDSKGNTWIPLTAYAASDGYAKVQLFYTVLPIVGTGHTFACSGTNTYPVIGFTSVTGGTAYFDAEVGAIDGSGTSLQPGSLTPSADGAFLVSAIAVQAITPTLSGSGYVPLFSTSHIFGQTNGGAIASAQQTTATAANPTWVWTGTPTLSGGTLSVATTQASFIFTPPDIGTGTGMHTADSAVSPALDTHTATLLVLSCSWYPGSTTHIIPDDSNHNTWIGLTPQHSTDTASTIQLFYTTTPITGTDHTFSCSGPETYPVVSVVQSANGVATVTQQAGAIDGSGTAITVPSLTPSAANALVVSGITVVGSSLAIGGSFTIANTEDFIGGVHMGGGSASWQQTTATAAAPAWTWTGSTASVAATSAVFSFASTQAVPTPWTWFFGGFGGRHGAGGGGGIVSVDPDPTDGTGYRASYRGAGFDTLGGRGGGARVCHITTLTISGTPTWGTSGDVADCLEGLPSGCPGVSGTATQCARFVVSDLSGITGPTLGTSMTVTIGAPFLTFAGQTAPSCSEGTGTSGCGAGAGGLTLTGIQLIVATHDVVLQHLRMRTLFGTQAWDTFTCTGVGCSTAHCLICIGRETGDNTDVQHVVLDHVSLAHGGGGTPLLRIGHGAGHVLVTDSILGEATDIGTRGSGGYAVYVDGSATCSVAFIRNAFINSWGQNPAFGLPCTGLASNNIIYNGVDPADFTGGQLYGQLSVSYPTANPPVVGGQYAVTNNVILPGPSSGAPQGFLAASINSAALSTTALYLQGNTGPGVSGPVGAGQWSGLIVGPQDAFPNSATAGANSTLRTSCTTGTGFTCIDVPFSWWTSAHLGETANTGTAVRDLLIAHVGARPLDRDATDTRLLGDLLDNGGTVFLNWSTIASSYGGLAPIVQRTRVVPIPASPNALDGAGRSTIETTFEMDAAVGATRLETVAPTSTVATVTDGGGYRPHYRGFGSSTKGGTGGGLRVCHITTLSISGTPTWGASGDARDCLEGLPPGCASFSGTQAACARYVVSDVSGETGPGLGSNVQITITGPYLTFAGQTAPGCSEGTGSGTCGSGAGGLSFISVRLVVQTHDVVLQHFRLRTYQGVISGGWNTYSSAEVDCSGVGCSVPNCSLCIGEANGDPDNSQVFNVVVDHVSMAWGGGGTWQFLIAAKGATNNVLVTDSLFGEPVDIGVTHSVGGYNGGSESGANCYVVYTRNAFISGWGRNPRVTHPCLTALVGNVLYNGIDNSNPPGGFAYGQYAYFSDAYGQVSHASQAAFVGNMDIPGPDSTGVTKFMFFSFSAYDLPDVKVYLDGNTGPGIIGPTGSNQWVGTFAADGWPCGDYPCFANAATGGIGSNVRDDNVSDWTNDWFTAANFVRMTAGTVARTAVLSNAGARPNDRDAADARMAADVVAGTGTNHLNWQYIVDHYGGLPALVSHTRLVTWPLSPNNPGTCGASRTAADCFLEGDPQFGAIRLEKFQGQP